MILGPGLYSYCSKFSMIKEDGMKQREDCLPTLNQKWSKSIGLNRNFGKSTRFGDSFQRASELALKTSANFHLLLVFSNNII